VAAVTAASVFLLIPERTAADAVVECCIDLKFQSMDMDVSGEATAVTGDIVIVAGTMVRLFGIDAPELPETCIAQDSARACGDASTQFLSDLIAVGPVKCKGTQVDDLKRLIGVCIADGRDLGRTMVLAGWAVTMPDREPIYRWEELKAMSRETGLWSRQYIDSWHWRQPPRSAESEPYRWPEQ
jgi:endonuclease YncB( thermonuclease family)